MHVKAIQINSPSLSDVNHLSKEAKLEWLMEEYGDMVMRLAYTYVKQKQLAEDISQEVFISCYKNLDGFQHKSSYKTWVYRITVNKCKDAIGSWSSRNIHYKDILSSIFTSGTKSTEDSLIEFEENEEVFHRVLELPVNYREVIILYYYEELTIEEISVLLRIKINTVKSRLHRARAALKSSIKEEI
ncbi:sigma-70 family RNA polymerase sigma factor [Cytobacillus suaedae]|nr:sigma-70 family RNA polymerase sigma factor [Cytobacillus suaedae]